MYKVKKEDLIGSIENFPIEVVQKMIERQVEQGNNDDVGVFQDNRRNNASEGGFDWGKSEERGTFWAGVIDRLNFDMFFDKYPTYPKVMRVWNEDQGYESNLKKVVFMKKCGRYLAWDTDTLEGVESCLIVSVWDNAADITETSPIATGELKEFPIEVIKRMVYEQYLQGNKPDVRAFQNYRLATNASGGFNWCDTEKGREFWGKVINQMDFAEFFLAYPKYPKVMKVWDHNGIKLKRVVIAEHASGFIAVDGAETIEDSKSYTAVNYWKYAEDLTLEEEIETFKE